MARGNKYKCRVCGKEYVYCDKCVLIPVPHLMDGFCSKEHADIFAILSKHGCHLASAEETLKALEVYNIEGKSFIPSIQAHIDALKEEVALKVALKADVALKSVEEQVEEPTEKQAKKKKA